MQVSFQDEQGKQYHWSSWHDNSQGVGTLDMIVPENSSNVIVRFDVKGGRTVHACYRNQSGQPWVEPRHQELFVLQPTDMYAKYHFKVSGKSCDAYVSRVWNAAGDGSSRESFEYWPERRPQTKIPLFEEFAQLGADSSPEEVLEVMSKAMKVIQQSATELVDEFKKLKPYCIAQRASVASENTVSAGLAVAAAATVLFPPVALGLGIGSAGCALITAGAEKASHTTITSAIRNRVKLWTLLKLGLARIHSLISKTKDARFAVLRFSSNELRGWYETGKSVANVCSATKNASDIASSIKTLVQFRSLVNVETTEAIRVTVSSITGATRFTTTTAAMAETATGASRVMNASSGVRATTVAVSRSAIALPIVGAVLCVATLPFSFLKPEVETHLDECIQTVEAFLCQLNDVKADE